MGIFNQQPNYNESYTKEKRGITGPQGPPARLAPLVTKVQKVIRVFKDPKVIRVFKVQKVIKV